MTFIDKEFLLRKQLSIVLLLAILTVPLSAGCQSAAARPVTRGELGFKLDELVTRYVPYGFAGTVLVARKGEAALHKAYGLANRSSGQANTLETLFDVGSLAKTFTAAAILRLEAQGKLAASDPIGRHLPGVPPDKSAITIAQVLSHTSGLPRDSRAAGIPANAGREEFVQKALAAPLRFAPGTKYSYSNLGFTLLAAIVEAASGRLWQDYVREQLIQPAGLKQTFFSEPKMVSDPRVAMGYAGPTDGSLEASSPDTLAWGRGLGATGILTTASDLHAWWLALQKEGLLSEAARKRVFTAPTVGDEPYGWHIETRADGSTRIHKGGVVAAYEAQFAFYPESGTVMILTMNKNIGMRAPIWGAIERVLLGKEYALPPRVAAATAPVEKYAGEYQLPSGGTISAWAASGRLMLGGIGQNAVNLLAYPENTDPQLHRDTNDATRRVVEALIKNDMLNMSNVPEPDSVKRFWQGGISRFGAAKSFQVLGTNPRAAGAVQTYVRVDFENEPQVIRFTWIDGKLGPLGTGIPMPGITMFLPQSPTEFSSFDYRTAQTVRVAVEADGAGSAKALRFLSREGKEVARATKTK